MPRSLTEATIRFHDDARLQYAIKAVPMDGPEDYCKTFAEKLGDAEEISGEVYFLDLTSLGTVYRQFLIDSDFAYVEHIPYGFEVGKAYGEVYYHVRKKP